MAEQLLHEEIFLLALEIAFFSNVSAYVDILFVYLLLIFCGLIGHSCFFLGRLALLLSRSFYTTWPRGYKTFLCSTQLTIKFSLLINMKMLTHVDIFIIYMLRKFHINFISAKLSRKTTVLISNLLYICR